MQEKSYWMDSAQEKEGDKLEENVKTQVCIIGAGITGIATAYYLMKAGKRVVILDKREAVSAVTARTTAKITSEHDLFYDYLIQSYGEETAKAYLQANEEAKEEIANIIKENDIDCDFERQDAYVYTCDENELIKIKKEVEAVKKLGFPAEYVEETELPFKVKGAIKFPNQAQFHVRKYLFSLIDWIKSNGGKIYTNANVEKIETAEKGYKIQIGEYEVETEKLVIATHYPILNFPGFDFLKMYQERSYVIVAETTQELFQGMYISAESPVISLKTIPNGTNKRLLFVGGYSHKTGDNSVALDDRYKDLEEYTKKLYPDAKIKYRWSTQDCISLDKIPYIGKFSNLMEGVYVATGFKKWGMTTSHVAAKIITDEIMGKENPYAKVFSATRLEPIKNHKELGNMLKQTIYSLAINKVKQPEISSEDLLPGTGGVVNHKGKKLGIYKDEKGKIYAVEPYCGHLGCELSWNNVEKTWDCPCHGSRFSYEGKVINEPSKKDLKIPDIE